MKKTLLAVHVLKWISLSLFPVLGFIAIWTYDHELSGRITGTAFAFAFLGLALCFVQAYLDDIIRRN